MSRGIVKVDRLLHCRLFLPQTDFILEAVSDGIIPDKFSHSPTIAAMAYW